MPTIRSRHLKDCYFLLLASLCFLLTASLLRGLLLWHNQNLASEIPWPDIAVSFLIGLRFDLIVTSYAILPLCLLLFFPRGLCDRKLARGWLGITSFALIFFGVAELDFYREFHTRLNSLVFEYIKEDPETVGRMIWAGFPVTRYLVTVGLIWAAVQWLIQKAHSLTGALPQSHATSGQHRGLSGLASGTALLLLFVIGARGHLEPGPPLRWGDAFHSEHVFSNHLGLNGTFTLIKAASASDHTKADRWWRKAAGENEALKSTRDLVLTDADKLIAPASTPLLRRSIPKTAYPEGQIRNVVFIIMESFAGAYVGALGDGLNITPHFDRLAAQGVLFERFFSNGTHTHQGMFASLACFPNLPGHEYLMQQPEGSHHFSGLPALFNPESDNNVYVYNGDFRWDNQEGFFRNQGMDRFIGRDDIENPKHMDDVWGVSDEDVFNQALQELDALDMQGQFYAVIQTLSNHTPFSLPEPMPIATVTGEGNRSEHLTAMRYSDWALGQFFKAAQQAPYFNETLFVIVGDHGFGTDDMVSAVDLNRFHVPLLLVGPGLQDYFDNRIDTVGSQVDIVPTIMGLLGKPVKHQCWGRDLLSVHAVQPNDRGFAIIKPSGSDQTSAIIRGRQILTLAPDMAPELGTITYGNRLRWQKEPPDSVQAAELKASLIGYMKTALDALTNNQTGLATRPGARAYSSSRPEGSSSLINGFRDLK